MLAGAGTSPRILQGLGASLQRWADTCAFSLQAEVIESEENFEQACRHGLSHGKLLSLRYLIPDIPWHVLQSTAEGKERLQAWMHRLVGLALRAASSALPPLSTPQETGLGMQTHPVPPCPTPGPRRPAGLGCLLLCDVTTNVRQEQPYHSCRQKCHLPGRTESASVSRRSGCR